MKRVLYITMGFGLFLALCLGCADKKKANDDLIAVSSGQANISIEKPDSTEQHPISIDYDYTSDWYNANKEKKTADKELYKLDAFTRLKNGEDQFTYYVLQELKWGDTFKSFLIYEYYESEDAVWLANYDSDYNLIDALEVHYSNAEGFGTTTSEIYLKDHLIKLTRYNVYETPETSEEKVKVMSNGKIEG